mmetsp:Transcript_41197/g.120423  ORF Transcript_41197/g.120423 Transcript_41197/m.120423 type:complete len:238 (+) Transcript_41197:621-1334(+)
MNTSARRVFRRRSRRASSRLRSARVSSPRVSTRLMNRPRPIPIPRCSSSVGGSSTWRTFFGISENERSCAGGSATPAAAKQRRVTSSGAFAETSHIDARAHRPPRSKASTCSQCGGSASESTSSSTSVRPCFDVLSGSAARSSSCATILGVPTATSGGLCCNSDSITSSLARPIVSTSPSRDITLTRLPFLFGRPWPATVLSVRSVWMATSRVGTTTSPCSPLPHACMSSLLTSGRE